LIIEQVCLSFKPNLKNGDKIFIVLFWSQPNSRYIVQIPFLKSKVNENIEIE
jgi:hypothetical protein